MNNSTTSTVSQQVRDAFNFGIQKLPLSGPDNLSTPVYGLFRDDTGDFVGSNGVTKRYTPHTTEDVCALVDACAEVVGMESCKLSTYWNNGHFVTIQPSKEYRQAVIGTKDSIWPRFILSAGFDKVAYKGSMGFWRDNCRNMQELRSLSSTHFSFRHTSSLTGKISDLISKFERLAGSWDKMLETIRNMQDTKMSFDDLIAEVYPVNEDASARQKSNRDATIAAIERRINNEAFDLGYASLQRHGNRTITAWQALTGVQGHYQHNATFRGIGSNRTASGYRTGMEHILRANNAPQVRQVERHVVSLAA